MLEIVTDLSYFHFFEVSSQGMLKTGSDMAGEVQSGAIKGVR